MAGYFEAKRWATALLPIRQYVSYEAELGTNFVWSAEAHR